PQNATASGFTYLCATWHFKVGEPVGGYGDYDGQPRCADRTTNPTALALPAPGSGENASGSCTLAEPMAQGSYARAMPLGGADAAARGEKARSALFLGTQKVATGPLVSCWMLPKHHIQRAAARQSQHTPLGGAS